MMQEKKENEYSSRFFDVMNRLKRQFRSCHQANDVYNREIATLGMIDFLMEEKKMYDNENQTKGVKVGDLVAHMHVTKSAISKMLRILEEKGLIERITDTKDRRNIYVVLSKEGQMVVEKVKSKGAAFTNDIIKELGNHDAEELIRILNKLYGIVEKKTKELDCMKEENHA